MENKDKPAYPVNEEATDRILDKVEIFSGLTKREYAAFMAMQGIVSSGEYSNDTSEGQKAIAQHSVAMADELLTQLNGK